MNKQNYIDPESKPYPFCPGCSHHNLFDRLDEALSELNLDLNKLVIVSDIGCIGIGDKHFKCHTFHGLHGRSITYSTGIKLARPDLTVINLIGDGGLGIGGTHFLNAARRNIDINVIVANNFNFGMTGGQHSVTTPHQSLTTTTPAGNIENSLDVCGLAKTAGCHFAARTLYIDKGLKDILKEAILTKGFSVVDVWELCIPYFTKNNQMNRQKLEGLREILGFEHGIVQKKEGPDYSAQLERLQKQNQNILKPEPLSIEFPNQLETERHILIAGSAGKKIKSTAALFGRAAVTSGLYVTERNDNPVTIMSGHSLAEIILSPKPIGNFGFQNPDIVLLVSDEGYQTAKKMIQNMTSSGVVYTFEEFANIDTKAKIKVISIDEKIIKIPKLYHAFFLLCHFLKDSGIFSLEALTKSIQKKQREEVLKKSLEILGLFQY